MPRAAHDVELASRLGALYHDYNRIDSASDPIQKVRPFADSADREVAGFCAAALAFGRVASVLNSIQALFDTLGPTPAHSSGASASPTGRHAADGASMDPRRRSNRARLMSSRCSIDRARSNSSS
jgi:hypothetical protein